ncbi:MAG: 1-acyl-sn-glycerol-3-phosphate acyltransferase [Chlamydiales bacterium]|nr:1-acyl-sn-glycerol-3-phosphate acyltransferase [Chlamydiales bacterium]
MSFFYTLSRASLKGLFKIAYGHEVILPEGVVYPEGAIIAANHASFLDPPLVAISWPEPIHFLARKTLFDVKLLKPLITGLNAHPLTGANDTSSLKLACRLLAEGKKILIFPEGTRSTDGELGQFKQGIGMLARKSGAAIIPTYIHNSNKAWPKGRKYPKLFAAKTACVFGKPIYLSDFEETDPKTLSLQIAARLHADIINLKNEFLKPR